MIRTTLLTFESVYPRHFSFICVCMSPRRPFFPRCITMQGSAFSFFRFIMPTPTISTQIQTVLFIKFHCYQLLHFITVAARFFLSHLPHHRSTNPSAAPFPIPQCKNHKSFYQKKKNTRAAQLSKLACHTRCPCPMHRLKQLRIAQQLPEPFAQLRTALQTDRKQFANTVSKRVILRAHTCKRAFQPLHA